MNKTPSEYPKRVLAIGCHPDDIEFMMAGTLFLLKDLDISYMNLANGNCGSLHHGRDELAKIREKEAQDAAARLGATWYPTLANDIEVLYDMDLVRKTAAVIRQCAPDIILIPALLDYMEDHMNTARIAVTAAFVIGMPNFHTIPSIKPVMKETALYHAMPYGLHDGLGNKVKAGFYVDISSVIDDKEQMLACHVSQRTWLNENQKLDSYLQSMRDMSAQMGVDGGGFEFAEGWIRHNPLGYSSPSFAPLEQYLHDKLYHTK